MSSRCYWERRGATDRHRRKPEDKDDVGAETPVVAVRIVTEDGHVLSKSPTGIAVEIGKPLDRDEVAKSIRALYGTGDYADVKAVTTPVGSGVRLDFVVRENLFFNRVLIEGLDATAHGCFGGRSHAAHAGPSVPPRGCGRWARRACVMC